MAALPYMPLYVADYLADAAHLTTQEHGAYLLLIMNYWQRGGPLPDDDVRLARIARVGPREWTRIRDNLSEFFDIADGAWSHSRVDTELARVSAKSLKSKKAAQASVERRFGKRSADVEPTDTDTDKEEEEVEVTPNPLRATDCFNEICNAASWHPRTDGKRQEGLSVIDGWLALGCSLALILESIKYCSRNGEPTASLKRFDGLIRKKRREQLGGSLPITSNDVGAIAQRLGRQMRAA